MKTYLTAFRSLAAAAVLLLLAAGCASTSQIEVNRKAPERAYKVVNVISGPDQAGDVSAALEAALQQHGFATRVNASSQDKGSLIARYKDTWKRNGVTYLNRLSIELLDADSKALAGEFQLAEFRRAPISKRPGSRRRLGCVDAEPLTEQLQAGRQSDGQKFKNSLTQLAESKAIAVELD